MAYTTYGFSNISMVLNHPSVGEFTIDNAGVGEITITAGGDVTAHNIAADGHVMISKMQAPNGAISITVQQVSPMGKYLKRWYNYVRTAALDEWASMVVVLRDSTNGETTTLTGVSPQTYADETYQMEGQQVTWSLMAAEVTRQ